MKKLAIILDSFSGRDEKWTKENDGFYFLPLQVIINEEIHRSGSIGSTPSKKLFELVDKSSNVKSSQPTPFETTELYKKLSAKYENVIYLPIGSAISGTAKTSIVLANDFPKVNVLDNFIVGKDFEMLGKYLIKKANEGMDIKEILKIAKDFITNKTATYIIPENIDNFIKSGRLGKTSGTILNKMQVIPVVAYQNTEKLHKKALKRTWKKAIKYAMDKIETKLGNLKDEFVVQLTYGPGKKLKEYAEQLLNERKIKFFAEETAPLICVSTGISAISIGLYNEIK